MRLSFVQAIPAANEPGRLQCLIVHRLWQDYLNNFIITVYYTTDICLGIGKVRKKDSQEEKQWGFSSDSWLDKDVFPAHE
ncbi:MAG: hypothetical protein C4308_12380 [Chitinophagaceae bacterium]